MTIFMSYLHIGSALAAYLTAFMVFTRRVGSKSHRYIGRGFAIAMLTTAISGLFIYNWGRLSVFHVFSVITIWSIGRGLFSIHQYRKTGEHRYLINHYYNMAYSFMGLNLAAIAQILRSFSYESSTQYLTTIAVAYGIAITFSVRLIRKKVYQRFEPRFEPKNTAKP